MESLVSIRKPKPDEYEQAVECIIEARGRNYYSENYYSTEYLFGGEHEIFAAFESSGEMAGICGLSCAPFEHEKTMLTLLNIKPSYTGRGIGTELINHCIETLKSYSAPCVKGYVITKYNKVQNMLEGFELKPTGIMEHP